MHPRSHDTHDESYFASFTDLLVGVIFIFIILLMIFANNYQQATESVTQTSKALEEARDKALQEEIARLRSEASGKELDKELAEVKALAEAKSLEAQQAAAMVQSLEEQIKALEETMALQSTVQSEDTKPGEQATSSEDAIKQQLKNAQQNLFNDSLAKVLQRIQETLAMQGYAATVDTARGLLLLPETSIFNPSQNDVSPKGKQSVYALASALNKYLPCISPTKNQSQLSGCAELNFPPNNGLDAIFIDAYPGINGSKEERLLLAVQRTISVFNELKSYDPYLYTELKNISGAPMLNIKVSQQRRKAWNQEQNDPAVKGHVVFRFLMRKPNQKDIINLKNAGQ